MSVNLWPDCPEGYSNFEMIGCGAYAEVVRARSKLGPVVAIKRITEIGNEALSLTSRLTLLIDLI